MSYLETGFLIGLILTHTGAIAIGQWLNDRKWQRIRERLAD